MTQNKSFGSIEHFIITGGFFDGTSEGFIGTINLERVQDRYEIDFSVQRIMEPPDEGLRLVNKGFSGASVLGDELWLCSANQVLCFNRHTFELIKTIDDPLFNDLHHVLAEKDKIIVVNTGLESIDFFSTGGSLIKRRYFTSEERTLYRTESTDDFRLVESKPHFMHANYCSRGPGNRLSVTFLRQRRIVDINNWSWSSPEYPAPPHEGFIEENCLWVTTVPGQIIACDPQTHVVVKKWELSDYNIPAAWTRGLCILEHGFLVGTTRIRKTNSDYFSRWNSEDTSGSSTAVHYIPFKDNQKAVSVNVLDERSAKIFSILKSPVRL